MPLTDEEWIAEARSQLLSGGSWQIPFTPRAGGTSAMGLTPAGPSCPACDGQLPLAIFRRPEIGSLTPLRYCERCFGFWAARDALQAGVSASDDGREALYARAFPAMCGKCGKPVHDRRRCRRCAMDLPPRPCPECGKAMDRFSREGVTLDSCGTCRGTWFDVGELALVHGLVRPQSLAMGTVDETAGPTDKALMLQALSVVSRVFLPFLPF